MDSVCRNFASRLERRRNIAMASVRFHRTAEEVSTASWNTNSPIHVVL